MRRLLRRSGVDRHAPALAAAALLAAACATTPAAPASAPEVRAEARAALAKGALEMDKRPKEARASLERARTLDPSLHEAAYDLALLDEREGALDRAAAGDRPVREAKPGLVPARQNLAALEARRGLAQAAAALYEDLAGDRQGDAALLSALALLHRASGDRERALDAARRALRADPASAKALAAAGLALAAAADADLAELVLARAPEASARAPQILLARGVAAVKRGRYEDALALFRAAGERDRRWPAPRLHAARLLLDAGDADGAAAEARAVIAARPEHAGAHVALGIALRVKRDLAGAEAAYRKALSLAPALPEGRHALSVLLMDHAERGAEAGPLLSALEADAAAPEALRKDARERLARLAAAAADEPTR